MLEISKIPHESHKSLVRFGVSQIFSIGDSASEYFLIGCHYGPCIRLHSLLAFFPHTRTSDDNSTCWIFMILKSSIISIGIYDCWKRRIGTRISLYHQCIAALNLTAAANASTNLVPCKIQSKGGQPSIWNPSMSIHAALLMQNTLLSGLIRVETDKDLKGRKEVLSAERQMKK